MPVTAAQLAAGANYTRMSYAQGDPVDQINTDRPTLKWLIDNKQDSIFGNGIFNEKVIISNDANAQNYSFDDQVSFNRRDTVRLAPFQHFEMFDGYALSETELANNGIILTDDANAVATGAEALQIASLIKTNEYNLKEGIQTALSYEYERDGSQNAKAVPGIDSIVSTTPSVGVVGGLDPAVYTFWRNNTNLGISVATAGNLQQQMDISRRQCMTYGGMVPDFYVCGSKFYDAYKLDCIATSTRMETIDGKGGINAGGGVAKLYYQGKELVWDPTFDALDGALGSITYPYAKRCYMLQSKAIFLRPFKGRWMLMRAPPRMYDRYTHYFGTTTDYGLTANKRNAMAVLSIA